MRRQALDACLEFSSLARLTAASCRLWVEQAEFYCLLTCANCTEIGLAMRSECLFQLQSLNNATLVRSYCAETFEKVSKFRCPAACGGTSELCRTEQAQRCMRDCGNFLGCSCRPQRASRRLWCEGETVVKSSVVSRPDLPLSCDEQLPQCYEFVNSTCGQFKYCPSNLCVIKDVRCPARSQCEEPGTCEPTEGACYYMSKPDGTVCDDGISYTSGDQCVGGYCVGTADYCQKYNVSCQPYSACVQGGECIRETGRCNYTALPDGTSCDDSRPYTVEDRCQQGLCIGQVVDLCQQSGVVCSAPYACYEPGTCDPRTGTCSPATAVSGRRCDDGDPTTVNDTCLDGICVGQVASLAAAARFQTLGVGVCADRDGRQMARYSGDVEDEAACEAVCRSDPQCAAYAYAYPTCSIYGAVRTGPPTGQREWSFQVGTSPPAVVVEKAMLSAVGQRASVCRRKGTVGDVQEPSPVSITVDDVFTPVRLGAFFLSALCLFFAWPIYSALRECCCQRRQSSAVASADAVLGPDPAPGDLDEDRLRAAAAATTDEVAGPQLLLDGQLEVLPEAALEVTPRLAALASPDSPAMAEPPGAVSG